MTVKAKRKRRFIKLRTVLVDIYLFSISSGSVEFENAYLEIVKWGYSKFYHFLKNVTCNTIGKMYPEISMTDSKIWADLVVDEGRRRETIYSDLKFLKEEVKPPDISTTLVPYAMDVEGNKKYRMMTNKRVVGYHSAGIPSVGLYRNISSLVMLMYCEGTSFDLYSHSFLGFLLAGKSFDVADLRFWEDNLVEIDRWLASGKSHQERGSIVDFMLRARGTLKKRVVNEVAMIIPWTNFDFFPLFRKYRCGTIFLPKIDLRKPGRVLGLDYVFVNDDVSFFTEDTSVHVFSIPRAFFDVFVNMEYDGRYFTVLHSAKEYVVMRFSDVENTKGTPLFLTLSDDVTTIYIEPDIVAECMNKILQLEPMADGFAERALKHLTSIDIGMTPIELTLFSTFITNRCMEQVFTSYLAQKYAGRSDLILIVSRLSDFLLRIGKSYATVIGVLQLLSGNLFLGASYFMVHAFWFLKRIALIARNVTYKFFTDLPSEVNDNPIQSKYLIFVERTAYSINVKLSDEAKLLLEKFENIAGVDRHMVNYVDKVVVINYSERPELGKVRMRTDIVNGLNDVITQVDPSYQLSHPNHHLLLRSYTAMASVSESLGYRTRLTPQDWNNPKMCVHLSKAGGGEMIRRPRGDGFTDALTVRNLGVIHQGNIANWGAYVEENFERYGDVVYCDDWREKIAFYMENPVAVDPREMEQMMHTMTPGKYAKYLTTELDTLWSSDTSQLEIILKGRVKEQARHSKHGVAQTVFFLRSESALGWLLLCKEVVRRQEMLYRPNIVSGDMKNDDELERRIDAHVPCDAWGTRFAEMADQSQFDKSEIGGAREIEVAHWKRMGVQEELINKWFGLNYRIRARFQGLAIKLTLAEMRRSGHPTTLFGNSIVTLFTEVVTKGYEKGDIIVMWFQGDDVFVLPRDGFVQRANASYTKAYWFNLIEKTERYKFAWYNCSRFLVRAGGVMVLVYDPLKMLQKFTRPLTVGEYSTLPERFLSYRSLVRNYLDPEVVRSMVPAMKELYGFDASLTMQMMRICASALEDYHYFSSIWSTKTVVI